MDTVFYLVYDFYPKPFKRENNQNFYKNAGYLAIITVNMVRSSFLIQDVFLSFNLPFVSRLSKPSPI